MAEPTSDRRTPDHVDEISTLEKKFKDAPEKTAPALAEAYIADGRPRDAIRILEKHSNGKDVERSVLLAQAWFDAFDNARSEQLLKDAAKAGSLNDSARAQVLLGELAFEAGRADDAKQYLKKAHAIDPKNLRAAQLLNNLGEEIALPELHEEYSDMPDGFRTDVEVAETASRAAIQVIGGVVLCAVLLGAYYWWSQKTYNAKMLSVEASELIASADITSLRNAETKYLEAREYQSGNEYAIAGLAETYTLLWADHGFEDAKEKAIEYVALAVDKDIEKAERYGAEILAAYAQNDYAAAEQAAAAVIEKGGVSEKLYFSLGLTQRAMGKPKLGRDNLRRAYDLKGDAPHYATALGDAYDEDNDDRNATFFWKLAADRNSNYVPGRARSLMARARRGEDSKLLMTELESLDALPPADVGKRDQAAIELARATLMTRIGKTKEGIAAAKKAVELIGETPRALAIRGHARLAEGKTKGGLSDLDSAHKKAAWSERYLYGLVDAYIGAGKHELAVQTLKVESGKMAQDPKFHTRMGDAYASNAKWAEAEKAYDKALKLHDEYPEALLGRGVIAWKQKKYDDATSFLEKAVGARTKFPEVYVAVGLMWVERGFLKEAHTQLDMAEKLFTARGENNQKMKRFYLANIKAYGKARKATAYVKQWSEREAAYRKSLGG